MKNHKKMSPMKSSNYWFHEKGLALNRLGQHKEALTCFEQAIKLNPKDHTAWHRKGIELNALERYNDALRSFQTAIEIDRRDHYAWNHRAIALREQGRYEEALRSCEEALKLNRNYTFGWYTKGSILHKMGDLYGAKECFERTAKVAPESRLYQERLQGICELIQQSKAGHATSEQLHAEGFACFRKGEHERALSFFERAILLNPDDGKAWHRKGIELTSLGRHTEALQSFDRALQLDSNDQYAWAYRGEALRELKRYDEALESLNEALKTNENYPFAWYGKGLALRRKGDNIGAHQCLEQAVQYAANHEWWDGGGVVNEEMYRKTLAQLDETMTETRMKEQIAQWQAEGFEVDTLVEKWLNKPETLS